MSIQPIERIDLEINEALDFEFTPECEHCEHGVEPRFHAGPAFALVRGVYGCCGRDVTTYVCEKWYRNALREPVLCRGCGSLIIGEYTVIGGV